MFTMPSLWLSPSNNTVLSRQTLTCASPHSHTRIHSGSLTAAVSMAAAHERATDGHLSMLWLMLAKRLQPPTCAFGFMYRFRDSCTCKQPPPPPAPLRLQRWQKQASGICWSRWLEFSSYIQLLPSLTHAAGSKWRTVINSRMSSRRAKTSQQSPIWSAAATSLRLFTSHCLFLKIWRYLFFFWYS